MRETEPLPSGPAAKEKRAHGGGLAETDCGDGRADVLEGVVDCQSRGYGAAGGVDVEVYVFVGVVGFEP